MKSYNLKVSKGANGFTIQDEYCQHMLFVAKDLDELGQVMTNVLKGMFAPDPKCEKCKKPLD